VAPRLLGHWLIRNTPKGPCGGPIVETEAYLMDDPACHGAPGLTRRNRVMFGLPGHGYVYFIYGAHYCVNAVCMPEGMAEAVLIRAIEPVFMTEAMMEQRPIKYAHELTNGPAKLCQALDIDRKLDGVDLCDSHSPLFIAENAELRSFRKRNGPVVTTRRIGITRAAGLLLRFYLGGSEYVSRRARSKLSKPQYTRKLGCIYPECATKFIAAA
jgi:DNA-3-methyladenine glycosylase